MDSEDTPPAESKLRVGCSLLGTLRRLRAKSPTLKTYGLRVFETLTPLRGGEAFGWAHFACRWNSEQVGVNLKSRY